MKWITAHRRGYHALAVLTCSAAALFVCKQASAQPVPGGSCKPVSERTPEVECWILAHHSIGELKRSQVFWHLDVYPIGAAAEPAKGARSTVIESLGKV